MVDPTDEKAFRFWWREEKYSDYLNKWIAFQHGDVTSSAETLEGLLSDLPPIARGEKGPIIAFVMKEGIYQ